jgi:Holliday junction resolvasome RuvABC DNA-binding subunit
MPPRAVGFTVEIIEKRVTALEELGFPRQDCERALRAAQFNMDRATDYLLSGTIPEPLVIRI